MVLFISACEIELQIIIHIYCYIKVSFFQRSFSFNLIKDNCLNQLNQRTCCSPESKF
jgi:hypothetical protein